MRNFIRQFMLYSRSERRAVIALVVFIMIVVALPAVIRFYIKKPTVSYRWTATYPDLLAFHHRDSIGLMDMKDGEGESASNQDRKLIPFYFDPNTIGMDEWQRMGLSEKQAAVIEKYKGKGGRFRKPDDMRKIYVLSDADKDQLVPYVRISNSDLRVVEEEKMIHYSIEINTADSAAFEELYGIGPYLASKVIKYRNSLGGFYRIEQVGEAYGMRDSTLGLIRTHLTVKPSLITKISINTVEYETLRKHPYVHAKIAHAIISYRNMNGKFESLEQLKDIKQISSDQYEKLSHYLTIN